MIYHPWDGSLHFVCICNSCARTVKKRDIGYLNENIGASKIETIAGWKEIGRSQKHFGKHRKFWKEFTVLGTNFQYIFHGHVSTPPPLLVKIGIFLQNV